MFFELKKPNFQLQIYNNVIKICAVVVFTYSVFVFPFFPRTTDASTCQWMPKKYQNFLFIRQEFILSVGYVMCVRLATTALCIATRSFLLLTLNTLCAHFVFDVYYYIYIYSTTYMCVCKLHTCLGTCTCTQIRRKKMMKLL